MALVKRVFVFLLVNILVIATIGTVLHVTGLNQYLYAYGADYQGLALVCLIWGMGGAFISLLLSRFMAKMMMGVKIIDPRTATGDMRDVLEMVHALSKRAGIKTMPEVGYYESPEVNAFATGPTKNKALVAVSTGLLQRMNRSQVEGVIGHEVAHVANGDMVTMTLVQGVVNAFVLFATHIITKILDNALRDSEGRGGLSGFAHFFAFQLISSVLSFMAYPIVAWVSRYREYRADAGGAKLAGVDKMVSALKALKNSQNLIDPSHAELATLKISGRRSKIMELMSTHPSLDDRIQRLEMGKF